MFGVNGWGIVLLALIAVFILGPDRLPEYAAKLARGIRRLRVIAEGAKGQLKDQLGPEYEDINWRQYDPRQYDPRRIVKEALLDPLDEAIAPVRGEIDSVRGGGIRARGAAAGGRRGGAGRVTASAPPRPTARSVDAATPSSTVLADRRSSGPGSTGPLRRRRHVSRSDAVSGAAVSGRRASGRASGRPGRGRASPRPLAMPRSATAAGESGSPSTTGMPWSAPIRSRVSSGIWPSSGTSDADGPGQRVGDLLPAAGAEDLLAACRRAARASSCSR